MAAPRPRRLLLACAAVLLAVTVAPAVAHAGTVDPTTYGTRITAGRATTSPGTVMLGGDALVAGSVRLVQQTDGNLVLYGAGGALWSSGTLVPGSFAAFRTNGNLVVYGPGGRAVWRSGTGGRAATALAVTADGVARITDGGGRALWQVGVDNSAAGIAAALLSTLNAERAENGLPALTGDSRLVASAGAHSTAMSQAGTLSHQLPGEAAFGDRITAAGYAWWAAGENIAWTGTRTVAGAQAIQAQMYHETPPNDGHRQNILSTSFTQVGVGVVVDGSRLWFTMDFGRPR